MIYFSVGISVALKSLSNQILDTVKSTQILNLKRFVLIENIDIPIDGKLDLSEVVMGWKSGLKAFINVLDYRSDNAIFWSSQTSELF